MATSAFVPTICQDNTINRKPREKRVAHHHHNHNIPHIRPMRPNDNRQRKLRAKQRPANLISTDGTTSGDDGSETKNKQEQEMTGKLEQMLRPSNQLASDLDLEADCEDNTNTDGDNVSLSGISNKHENDMAKHCKLIDEKVRVLNSKIVELEKQLAIVVQHNLKLKEENNKLKKSKK